MPAAVTDAFGNTFQACSISTMVKAQMPKGAWPSEAQWARHVKADAFNTLRQKINNGEVVKNTVVGRTANGGKLVYKGGGKLELTNPMLTWKPQIDLSVFDNSAHFTAMDWDFGPNMAKLAQQQKLIVDTPAKLEKWVNDSPPENAVEVARLKSTISGNEYSLKLDGWDADDNVTYKFFKIGDEPNATIITKIELENFQKSDLWKVEYKVGQAPPPLPQPVGLPVASTSKSVGAITNEDAATMFVKTKDKLAQEAGLNIKGASKIDDLVYKTIADQTGYTPAEIKAKIDAYKATGKKLSALKKKVLPKNGNPTKGATEKAVDNAADAVKKEELKPEEVVQVWDDEAVAKAYIKAKDHVVATNDKGWTLYTKSPDFDSEIHKWMQADLGPIKWNDANTAIANYIANTQKLSVLKKQMIKKGELKPQADTLKGGKKPPTPKAEKPAPDTSTGGVGKTTEDPSKIHPKQQLTETQEQAVFGSWEGMNLPLSTSGQKLYEAAKGLAKSYGLGEDVLPILRAVDKLKAKKFNAPNANLYEKKVLEHLANPAPSGYTPPAHSAFDSNFLGGQSFGELPEDSELFKDISDWEMTQLARGSVKAPTPQQISALKSYSGSYYQDINRHLRTGGELGRTMFAKDIQAAMQPMPADVIARRGTSLRGLGVNSFEELYQSVGKTFKEPGFSSTAVGGVGQFSGQVNLVIQVPKGAKAVWLKPYSNYSSENELLLAAGTRFRILKVEEKSTKWGKQTVVHVRVEP